MHDLAAPLAWNEGLPPNSSPTHPSAGRIFWGALAAGVCGDALLRVGPVGINVALWAGCLVGLVYFLTRGRPVVSRGDDLTAVVLLLGVTGMVAWHASVLLNFLVLCGLGAVLVAALAKQSFKALTDWGMLGFLRATLTTGAEVFVGSLLLSDHVSWGRARKTSTWGTLLSILRGVLLALPLLIVFGGLLMAADAVFSVFVRERLHLDLRSLISHLSLIGAFTWITAGYLHGLFFPDRAEPRPWARRAGWNVPTLEMTIALGLLDALFLLFAIIQFRYLFGGGQHVQATAGVTYAQYARHGFFELAIIAALVLALLLCALSFVQPGERTGGRLPAHFKLVMVTMVALVFVMIASALLRMHLYQQAYGLTILRIYTTAFMLWLAVLFAWFVITLLRERPRQFAMGALVSAFVTLLALQAINPNGLIVRVDVARALGGHALDVNYLQGLSIDAAADIVHALPTLSKAERCALAPVGSLQYWAAQDRDWRRWNYSRWSAAHAAQKALAAGINADCAVPTGKH